MEVEDANKKRKADEKDAAPEPPPFASIFEKKETLYGDLCLRLATGRRFYVHRIVLAKAFRVWEMHFDPDNPNAMKSDEPGCYDGTPGDIDILLFFAYDAVARGLLPEQLPERYTKVDAAQLERCLRLAYKWSVSEALALRILERLGKAGPTLPQLVEAARMSLIHYPAGEQRMFPEIREAMRSALTGPKGEREEEICKIVRYAYWLGKTDSGLWHIRLLAARMATGIHESAPYARAIFAIIDPEYWSKGSEEFQKLFLCREGCPCKEFFSGRFGSSSKCAHETLAWNDDLTMPTLEIDEECSDEDKYIAETVILPAIKTHRYFYDIGLTSMASSVSRECFNAVLDEDGWYKKGLIPLDALGV
jgi:hypothetical protein